MFSSHIKKTFAKAIAFSGSATAFAAAPMIFKSKEDRERDVPGDKESWKTRIGESVASIAQTHAPMNEFRTHTSELKLMPANTSRQFVTHSFVNHINEDFMQAVIMDGEDRDARMIGVSYVISERLFNKLPEEEKKLWSSNAFEVKSGIKVAPRMPWAAEHKLMSDLAPTYSKTFLLWDKEKDPIPLGIPQLLANPVKEYDVDKELLRKRDRDMKINTEEERKNRSDIPFPSIISGADSWANGETIVLQARGNCKVKTNREQVMGSRKQSSMVSGQPAYSGRQ